jgi:hypothetical protein
LTPIIWESFDNGLNRRLNTFDKKEIILEEEMNNKKVIEEYVEDKSLMHQSRGSNRNSINGSANQLSAGIPN